MGRIVTLAGETVRTAALGALFGTSPFTLSLVVLGVQAAADQGLTMLGIIGIPFLIGFAGTLTGFAIVGRPLTWWLSRHGRENCSAYVWAGAIGGAIIAALVIVAISGLEPVALAVIGTLGALTGAVIGHSWWSGARQAHAASSSVSIAEEFG